MAKYYRHYLNKKFNPPDVPIGPLKGGKVALSSRASAVFDGLDRIPAMGKPVILHSGLNGSTEWADHAGGTTTDAKRPIAKGEANLSPGSFLGASVLYLPAGQAQDGVGGDLGASGRVYIDVTWTDRDGASTTTEHTIEMDAIDQTVQSQDPWMAVKVKRHMAIRPGSLVSIVTSRKWSRGTHVTVTLSIESKAFVIDACVFELPHSIALEADDSADYRVNGMHSVDNPMGAAPALSYPVQRRSETSPDGDFRSGTWQVMDQVAAQQLHLRPKLWTLSGHDEENDLVSTVVIADDSYMQASAAVGTWTRLPDGNTNTDPTALLTSGAGFSMSSGAYHRPTNENPANSMANTGSIPVRIRVRIFCASPGPSEAFTLRVYTSRYNYIEISDTATTAVQTFTAYGHLECGIGPGHAIRAIPVINRETGSHNLFIYDVECEPTGQIAEAG